MKKLTSSLGLVALLALILSNQVKADIIVDTGTPNQLDSAIMLSNGQWLAAEFTTTQAWQITSLKGFITADTSNPDNATYTVALYDNNAIKNRPDTTSELFAQQATFGIDGWNGLQGLNVALNAGTYWLAFEVRADDTLQGLMPVFAPNALQTASNDATGNAGYLPTTGANYNFGVQISAVPVPPSLFLFASGLLAMGGRRLVKRQSI
ncbi:MAG: PEP-CTERM sorting domain-containing protein [Methylococcaceae bacterium]